MADLTMCTNKTCPNAKTCWLQLAPKSYMQSWQRFEWRRMEIVLHGETIVIEAHCDRYDPIAVRMQGIAKCPAFR